MAAISAPTAAIRAFAADAPSRDFAGRAPVTGRARIVSRIVAAMNRPRRADQQRLGRRMLAGLEELSPSYFALVMATGNVSLAAHQQGPEFVAQALFGLNVVAWLLLWFLYALRMLWYPRRFFGDMVDHLRGPGFFTSVAATAVLGAQFVILGGDDRLAVALWGLALLLWIGLTYTIFAAFTIKEDKPPLNK